jgi:hypothetical protein
MLVTHSTEELMNWLWTYFRRKTFESILAGVNDALTSKTGSPGLTDEQAARALQSLMGGGDAPEADPPALAAPEKRGPGRPRKFQEPPQP